MSGLSGRAAIAGIGVTAEPSSAMADSGSVPSVSPLDRHRKSGVMPPCSQANKVPVRPKPTAISSAIRCTW